MSARAGGARLLAGVILGALTLAGAPAEPPPPPAVALVDFAPQLERPAGRRGFVRATVQGHFAFDDGTPARFFGINVSHESIFRPPAEIDRMVATFARAGLNLVRLHHMDERGGLLEGRRLRADRLEQLDYWIAALKQQGLYAYLDLLDYRVFRAAEGVRNAEALGRGARPYAVFDPRLIALQLEYAGQLLGHVNRFTGVRYADEPAVALIELFDENGLFRRREWNALSEPYRTELQARWHRWLRARDLRPAPLPDLGNPRTPRISEAVRFAAELHTEYFRTLRDHLRRLGVRVPVTAVGRYDELADLQTVATELDFVGINFYWDHPFWPPGRAWTLPAFVRGSNPLGTDEPLERSFAPQLCLSKVSGKPLVIREWNYCWPNPYRGGGLIEATAYAALQDLDALLLFDYRADGQGIGYFDVSLDPARWRLVPHAAQAFLRRSVSAAKPVATLSHTPAQVARRTPSAQRLTAAAWTQRVEHRFGSEGFVLPVAPAGPVIVAATGEITRYPALGFLQVQTPTFVARAGNLSRGDTVLGPLSVEGLPSLGAIAITALDREPLAGSRDWLLTLTTDYANRGQKLVAEPTRWLLAQAGDRPVVPLGEDRESTLSVSRNGEWLLRVSRPRGTVELAMRGATWYLHCDGSNGMIELARPPKSLLALNRRGEATPLAVGQRFDWPVNAQHIAIGY